jgi:hypothetical protein
VVTLTLGEVTSATKRTATWASPLAAVGLALLVDPHHDGPTLCPFALLTGTACPGCGLTRAAAWLIRGDLGAALSLHPLVLLVAAWAVAGWVGLVLGTGGARPVARRVIDRALLVTAASFVLVWVVRLAGGTLPPV